MKILPVNNKKNIASKATFKPNENFKTLYGKHKYLYDSLIIDFKKMPNHELEITELVSNSAKEEINCTVFNNTTKRAVSVLLDSFDNGLNDLLLFLISDVCSELFRSGSNQANLSKFNFLTKNDNSL